MDITCFFRPFPVIDLEDITLRQITINDANDYYDYMSRDIMLNFVTKNNIPSNIDEAKKEVLYWGGLFDQKKSVYWGIEYKANKKLIGTAGFNLISFVNSRADVSYDLDHDYWNKGIMLKSLKAIFSYSDNILRLIRTQAFVINDNTRSIKLLERCNFTKEGELQKFELVNNHHRDYFIYARINENALIAN